MARNRAAGAYLVTGAASGFGKEFAKRLHARGERLWLWDRDTAGLAALEEELGSRCHVETVDVTNAADVLRATEASAHALGPLGHVVNCAGILRVGLVEDVSSMDYQAMLSVNVLGSIHVAQATLPYLRKAGEPGRPATLLLVASVAGLRGFPRLAGYCASKFAVVGFAQALRDEVAGDGVDVRVLCPPPGDTPMVRNLDVLPPIYKLSRLYTAAEVVEATLRGLEGNSWLLMVDLGSKAMWRVGRAAPAVLDQVIRWAGR